MTKELKPCPFCGGAKAVLVESKDGTRPTGRYFQPTCNECGATALGSAYEHIAHEYWNRRAVEPNEPPSAGFYVEECMGGYWRRSALAHIWETKEDAQEQLRQLRQHYSSRAFRLAMKSEGKSD